ncbi:MAG: hypothetical protein JSU73_08690 [candidate division WOR-3 bacterium]|nr:MAG: hypothetical protein JSU73_08690 [candidate division WOR-3 bacterium]
MRRCKAEGRSQKGRRVDRVLLVCLLSVAAITGAERVEVQSSSERVDVSVIQRTDLGYYLLAANRPLEFEVQGPTWIRVYTRLWWPDGVDWDQAYRMSLCQGDVERPLAFESGLSKSSFGPDRRRVGKWRSFYVQVPSGVNNYRLKLDDAPCDTVGIRFTFRAPKPWQPVAVPGSELVLADGADTVRMTRLELGAPLNVTVSGPCRLRVSARLNFEPSMVGAQNFVLTVDKGGQQVATDNFRVSRSGAVYVNEPGLVPSSRKGLRFNLGEGVHRLSILLSGTLARSAGVLVERIVNEKYE